MGRVSILGVYVADTTFRADRQPDMGETILGKSFALGPGGKGSNQAVAAARAGAETHFISKLGDDAFADMARAIWAEAGVVADVVTDPDSYTGAAYIFVDDATGNNAIIISPGVAATISLQDVEAQAAIIRASDVFMTQLEQPIEAACAGLSIALEAGVKTILNPAPAADLPDEMIALSDLVTPNESEAEGLTGVKVTSDDTAEAAARILIDRGAGAVIVTLGENGALYVDAAQSVKVPAISAGPVAETTGAGDAFNGAFAARWSDGATAEEALRFAAATAAISVTRPGTAASMPDKSDVEALLAAHWG